MKKLIFTFLFSTLVFSSPSYAGWTIVNASDKNTLYVDFDRIRKHDGYVYFWQLLDYLKRDEYGDLSTRRYVQGDCKLFRWKVLSDSFYRGPMGRGTLSSSSNTPDNEWDYAPPNSYIEDNLKQVCSK